jgi:Ca2+-binding RTX toxin-like protein
MAKKGKSRGNRSYSSYWGTDQADFAIQWNTEGDFFPAWLPLEQIVSSELPFDSELVVGETQRYLPLYVNNDGVRDGLDVLTLEIEEDSLAGFDQEIYILQESWDQIPGDVEPFGFSTLDSRPTKFPRTTPTKADFGKMFLINELTQPLSAPKLVSNGKFKEAVIVIEDAQRSAPSIRLDNQDNVYVDNRTFIKPPQDSEYFESAIWQTFASDGAIAEVSYDSTLTKEGFSSLKLQTQSGFDTGVKIVAPTDIHWDLSDRSIFTFWAYAVNNNSFGFQGNQPVIVLNSPNGSFRYEPQGVLMTNQEWRQYSVPLLGSKDWNRTIIGSPSFSDITSIEIHQDTWDYGFTVYYDGLKFLSGSLFTGEAPPSPAMIYAGGGNDAVTAFKHEAQIFGESGNDTLRGNGLLYGGSGNDQLYGNGILDGMTGDDVLIGDGILVGGGNNDLIYGGSQNNKLFGGSGDDILSTGLREGVAPETSSSIQFLFGEAGSDRFDFYRSTSEAGVLFREIRDFDAAEGDKIGIYVGREIYSNFSGVGLQANVPVTTDQFHKGEKASDANDRFIYNDSSLYFDPDGTGTRPQVAVVSLYNNIPLSHNDIVIFDDSNRFPKPSSTRSPKSTLEATDQDDILTGTTQSDQITGLMGNDLIRGSSGRDKIRGGKGNDKLSGGDGNDTLNGGAGQDWLYGDRGQDKLIGGQDKDLFVLQRGGRDTVLDFQDRRDRLGLLPGMKFKQLQLESQGRDTLISMNNRPLALIKGVSDQFITKADFTSIEPFPVSL